MTETLTKFFGKQARKLGPELAKEYGSVDKWMAARGITKTMDSNGGEVTMPLVKQKAKIDLTDWDTLTLVFQPQLATVAKRGALQALAQLGITDSVSTESVSEQALAFAKDRAAELVCMNWDGDKLITNPNAEWAITDSTRDMLRSSIESGVQEGLSVDALSEKLQDSYAFSAERATSIARTELAYAHTEGNLTSWKESGVVEGKQSLLSSEHTEEDECNDAADEGVIPIDADFSTGDSGPPYHTNCECALIAVLAEKELDEA